jgi:hypothetical protein
MQEVQSLKALLRKSRYAGSEALYLEQPVQVGANAKGPAVCTYIGAGSGADFYLNVLFTPRKKKELDQKYEVAIVTYSKAMGYEPAFTDAYPRAPFRVFGEAPLLVLEELQRTGEEWIEYQKMLRVTCHFYQRWAESQAGAGTTLPEMSDVALHKLLWNRQQPFEEKKLYELIRCAQKGWIEKAKAERKAWRLFAQAIRDNPRDC